MPPKRCLRQSRRCHLLPLAAGAGRVCAKAPKRNLTPGLIAHERTAQLAGKHGAQRLPRAPTPLAPRHCDLPASPSRRLALTTCDHATGHSPRGARRGFLDSVSTRHLFSTDSWRGQSSFLAPLVLPLRTVRKLNDAAINPHAAGESNRGQGWRQHAQQPGYWCSAATAMAPTPLISPALRARAAFNPLGRALR